MNQTTQVLIIGGGFAGVSTAQALANKGIDTLLVDKKDYFEVTFATLRNIAAPHKTNNSPRKTYQSFLKGNFIQAAVTYLDTNSAQLDNGTTITFDKVVIASGTRYPTLSAAKSNNALAIEQRNQEMLSYHQKLQQANSILIIGGGIVGVELAGEIADSMPNKKVTLAHNSDALLDGFKPKAQQKALSQLQDLGVNVLLSRRIEQQGEQYIDNQTQQEIDTDFVLSAVGVVPNNDFLKANLPYILNEQGFVKVDANLQVTGRDNFYALGDIADVGEAKLGYLAQQQGDYLAKVILKSFSNKSHKPYKRNPLMALIPTGQRSGVVQLPFMVTTWNGLVNIKQKDLFVSKMYKAFGTTPNA
ncbi:FAD-dependent oxidoreductase [Psychrobium sp. MM17-31]|uniref:NAD(P)/FAD-dependent oxidoreductase n=1 Tax=Psychrobium sp. MM17-31 TaxID=2917758 RepID=UPI001EF63BE2|nr:FAD-dependent oxidoreductase [Psychrobium sp. MM17-31]MCG7530295.1 FAD-dependent oxidoreductase [Psychrobium sp. MM17-31]